MKKPNILWICSDQQRWDTLGCYGNSFVKTPNIDTLAEEGILFEQCYVQNPVCSPSRSSFLTGRYPRTTGCRENGQPINRNERIISKILHDAGYVCGLAGKHHLMPADPAIHKIAEERIDDGYNIFNWSHGHAPKHPANQYQQWLQENGISYKTENYNFCKWIEKGMPEEYHQTTWCVERAISFINQCSQFDSPWMFSINFFDPHPPFDPPESYLKRYLKFLPEIPLPNYQERELDNKPLHQKRQHLQSTSDNLKNIKVLLPTEMSDNDHRYVKAAYWAMVDLIDAQVGRLIHFLKKNGQYENTIIIYMSDHGEMLGDHGIYYKGLSLYDPAVHVPLIIHYPKTLKPQRYESLIEILHLAPTILEAVGLEKELGMQSDSLWKYLINRNSLPNEDIYAEYYNSLVSEDRNNYCTMVRTDDYKLVVYHQSSEGELYDLKNNNLETVNYWSDPAYAKVKTDLLIRMCNKMVWTIDPLPLRQSKF